MKRRNYKIDLEIYLIFIVVIGISVFNAIYSSLNISRNQKITTKITTVEFPSLNAIEDMSQLVTRSKMYATNWVYLQGNREDRERLKTLQETEYPRQKRDIQQLMTKWSEKGAADTMNLIFQEFEKLIVFQKEMMSTLVTFEDYEDPMKKFSAEEMLESRIIPSASAIIASLDRLTSIKNQTAEQHHVLMTNSSRNLMWSVLGIAILIIVVILSAAFYMSNNMIVPTMRLRNYILQMGKGEVPEMDIKPGKNAVGQMVSAVTGLAENLRRTAHFAHLIGDGKLDVQYQPLGDKDELGNALLQMQAGLRQADEENRYRNWLNTGLAQVNDVLREHPDDLAALSDRLVSMLVNYLGAYHGALYMLEKDDLSEKSYIQLHGSFALDAHSKAKRRFETGEGLIGQVIHEQKPLYIEHAPPGFVRISSGTGDAAATYVLIIPLKNHGDVYGAIEIAGFKPFAGRDKELLCRCGEIIASTVASVRVNSFTRLLLDETRKQAERLAAQEEELRQTNDELSLQSRLLQASEEELKQSNMELKGKAIELEQKNEVLEQARQALIIKAKELELNSSYKSEFLANMSHELRTPLNSVLILAKLLSENRDSNLTEKQMEYARVIHKSGSDLLVLINDILDLSKIEAGKVEMIFEQTPVHGITGDLLSLFCELAQDKKIDFEIELHKDLPENIVTDRVRLEQVLKNLLSNAFKFTPAGGKVTLRICRPDRSVLMHRPEFINGRDLIELSVIDSGIGIPAEKQQLIFNAFQQADGSTSRRYGGTGLGLSISKMLVSLLGGEIHVSSEQGKGSTFSVFIPVGAGSERYQSNQQGVNNVEPLQSDEILPVEPVVMDDRETVTRQDRVILIVEEDARFAKVLVDMAHERDYKALVATNSDDGLKYASELKPNGIILDMQLAGTDGWSLMNKFKSVPGLSNVPVHLLSAMDRQHAAIASAAILKKPFDKLDLDSAFSKLDDDIRQNARKVLIIEDERVQQDIMQQLLQSHDRSCSISTAASKEEAERILGTDVFDCIILDLDLGKGPAEGEALLYAIKDSPEHGNTPVIIVTAMEMNQAVEQRLRGFSDAVIQKDGDVAMRLLEEASSFLNTLEDSPKEGQLLIPEAMQDLLKNRTIILVDDDMRNIYALGSVLEEIGMKVVTATNGREAIEVLEKTPAAELILMDIMMPEMDGYQAMKEIRSREKHRQLPIIALTAKAMMGDREKCLQAGASDYISKPVQTDKLLSLMRVWLYKGE